VLDLVPTRIRSERTSARDLEMCLMWIMSLRLTLNEENVSTLFLNNYR